MKYHDLWAFYLFFHNLIFIFLLPLLRFPQMPFLHPQSAPCSESRKKKNCPVQWKNSTQVPHTDEVALNGGLGGTESKTNVLVPSPALANLLALGLGLRVKEDVRLLLERTFRLDGQLGRHCCDNSVRRGKRSRANRREEGGCRAAMVGRRS